MNRASSMLFATAVAAAFALSPAASQCALQWQPGDPIPTVHGDAKASTVWDPDGAGPAPALLVVGGRFGAGAMLDTGLATFDGASWGALGTPPMPAVTALTTWNGLLVAAGGSGTQHVVATWNGTTWAVIGNASGAINALAVFNGDLFAGGLFSLMNLQSVHNLVRWNGTAWSEPGGGVVGEVLAMNAFGSLYVGGFLTQAGALPVGNLAIWSGSSWSAGPTFNGRVCSLASRTATTAANSFLFAGGEFTSVGPITALRVARFTVSTSAWTAIPGLSGTSCRALHVRSTGALTFQLHAAVADGFSSTKVWQLVGSTWQSLGSVTDESEPLPTSLAFFDGQYVATFEADAPATERLERAVRTHDGVAWHAATGPGFDDRVFAMTTAGDDVVVGGVFRHYGTSDLAFIARGGPGAWQPLGSGIDGIGVLALCTLSNGDIVAGGVFTSAGGIAVNNIARWNGSSWLPLGTGINGPVHALLALPNGALIAGGGFTVAGSAAVHNIARWNGSVWMALGSGVDSSVDALARRNNGDVIAAGNFFSAGGAPAQRIARWNGSSWAPLGSGLDINPFALAVLADDTVVVGGPFTTAGGVFTPSIARWDGTSWFAQSTPTTAWDDDIGAIVALPNGDYIAGGLTSFFGLGGPFGGTNTNLARHTGGVGSFQWDALDLRDVYVSAAVVMPNGDVVVGGLFDGAGGLGSRSVATLRPTCPATAASYGSGCTGSGGANALAATALPWTGSTFRARATGMPALAFVLAVTGFSQLAIPMPAVLPQGVAGCTVLVSPDLLDVVLPTAGVATTQIAIPATPALVGQSFHHQVAPLEVDLAGNIVAITSTNALTLTIGVL